MSISTDHQSSGFISPQLQQGLTFDLSRLLAF